LQVGQGEGFLEVGILAVEGSLVGAMEGLAMVGSLVGARVGLAVGASVPGQVTGSVIAPAHELPVLQQFKRLPKPPPSRVPPNCLHAFSA